MLARDNYSYKKYQKEMARKKKAEEKKQRKQEKKRWRPRLSPDRPAMVRLP
jgi:hypothetical protein